MQASSAVALLAASPPPAPQLTELVPVRPNAQDNSWPPVLWACVLVVLLGGLIVAIVFLRKAYGAARPPRKHLDG